MPIDITTGLGTTQPYIGLTDAGEQVKIPLPQSFATLSALTSAVVVERSNANAGFSIWPDGLPLFVAAEPDSVRYWNATARNAWRVRLPGGKQITLTADSSTVTSVSAPPSGGADGNAAIDVANGLYYTRAGGVWTGYPLVSPQAPLTNTASLGTITLNAARSKHIIPTLTGNVTLANPTGAAEGQELTVFFTQGSSPWTIAYGSDFIFPTGHDKTLSTEAGARDMLTAVRMSGKWQAALSKRFA